MITRDNISSLFFSTRLQFLLPQDDFSSTFNPKLSWACTAILTLYISLSQKVFTSKSLRNTGMNEKCDESLSLLSCEVVYIVLNCFFEPTQFHQRTVNWLLNLVLFCFPEKIIRLNNFFFAKNYRILLLLQVLFNVAVNQLSFSFVKLVKQKWRR